jgi:excisionase family DNA binding protein
MNETVQEQTNRWVESCSLGEENDQFLQEIGLETANEAARLGASKVTVDLWFMVFLRRFSRFGYFQFGPIAIDVRLVEDLVERTIPRGGDGLHVEMSDELVPFSRLLMQEVQKSGRRRIDELAYLLTFMRWKDGIPGRVFGELGVTPEQVEGFVRDRAIQGPAVPEKLYTPEEAADYLGVHIQTVRAWIRAGRLRASRLAGQRALRIRASDLNSVLEPVDPYYSGG